MKQQIKKISVAIFTLVLVAGGIYSYQKLSYQKKYKNIIAVSEMAFNQNRNNALDWSLGEPVIRQQYQDYFSEKGLDSFFYHYHLELDGGGICRDSDWEMTVKDITITLYEKKTEYYSFDVEVFYKNTAGEETGSFHFTGKFRMDDEGKLEYWTADQQTLLAVRELAKKFQSNHV